MLRPQKGNSGVPFYDTLLNLGLRKCSTLSVMRVLDSNYLKMFSGKEEKNFRSLAYFNEMQLILSIVTNIYR